MDTAANGINLETEDKSLWESELLISDSVGRLLSFWGFKKNMGRVWAVLFLANKPLTAKDLRDYLQISSGSVSMTLAELTRWGVARKVWVHGDRKDFYLAEANIWKMISRVLRERERNEIIEAITSFEKALAYLDQREKVESKELDRLITQRQRIKQLLDIAGFARKIVDALLAADTLDTSWVKRFLWSRNFSASD